MQLNFDLDDIFADNKRDQENLYCEVDVSNNAILIGFEGYGDCTSSDEHGRPVVIEIRNGVPFLLVWADINDESPTHIIDMAGAALSKRKEEADETSIFS